MSACSRDAGSTSSAPNIVLIVMDTVRADRLSSYGYPLPTTPMLDMFARQSIRFAHAYSTSSWTLPGHASLFTGLSPAGHGAGQQHQSLAERFTTLAELLSSKGYSTAAFSANPWVAKRTGLLQGFQQVHEMWRPEESPVATAAHPTNARVLDWLDEQESGRPFFLFINYMEAHYPYEPVEAYRVKFAPPIITAEVQAQAEVRWTDWYLHRPPMSSEASRLRSALYDAEVGAVDAAVGALLQILEARGLYDSSVVIVTSDHGENLGDHGHQDHVFSLYNSTLRVPLLIRLPSAASGGVVRTDPVQLTDVFATIAALAEVAVPPTLTAANLLTTEVAADRPVIAEYDYPRQALDVFAPAAREAPELTPFKRDLRSIQIGAHKLIWASDGRHELYEMGNGTDEGRNVIDERPEIAQRLAQRIAELTAESTEGAPAIAAQPAAVDAVTLERLRALGYAH